MPPHVDLLCKMGKVSEAAQLLCALGRWEDAFESLFCAPPRGRFVSSAERCPLRLSDVVADGLLQWRRLAALEFRPGRWGGLVPNYSLVTDDDAASSVDDNSIWVTLLRFSLKAGDSGRVRKLFERLPYSTTIIGVLAVVNGALAAEESNAASVNADSVLPPLVVLAQRHVAVVDALYEQMRDDATKARLASKKR